MVLCSCRRKRPAQDAKSVVDETTKAMGAAGVTSLAYAGTAADVNFLQTRNINGPWPLRKIDDYVRILDLSQTASRATGITSNQGLFGGRTGGGVFTQAITPASATWTQQLDLLGDAVGLPARSRGQRCHGQDPEDEGQDLQGGDVVSGAQGAVRLPYTVNGYINDQGLIERVETWVNHDMLGDMHVEVSYSDYKGWAV
jgi:hypothetical protein